MKKMIIGTLALGLVGSAVLGSSALANQEDLQPENQIEVSNVQNENIEPAAFPAIVAAGKAVGNAANRAWKAMPAGDRAMVTQAAQSAIGLGGVEKDDNKVIENKDLEYIFDN